MSQLREYLDNKIRELEHELETLKQLRRLLDKGGEGGRGEGFDSLPWRQYKDGNGEWIFENEAPEELMKQIAAGGGKAVIGNYFYDLSTGQARKRFVRRRPQKKG